MYRYDRVQAEFLKVMLAKGKPSARWAKDEYVPEWPLEADTWYRSIFYKDDHMIDPRFPEDALCGRPLEPAILDALLWEAEQHGIDLGPSHLYLSSRKGNKCSACKSIWGNEYKRDAILWEAGLIHEQPEYSAKPQDRIAAHREAARLTMVKRELGAVEVET